MFGQGRQYLNDPDCVRDACYGILRCRRRPSSGCRTSGGRQGAQATEEELKLHVRNTIAHFKTPQWISFVDELPKTATGKVQKYVLRSGKAGIVRQ